MPDAFLICSNPPRVSKIIPVFWPRKLFLVPTRINIHGDATFDGGCKAKLFQYTEIYGDEKIDEECNWEGGLKRVHVHGEAKL